MKKQLWIAGALLPLASAGHAQVVGASAPDANLSVAQRSRPGYEAIGGRIGSFFLYPRIDVTGYYTDNLRATAANKLSDEVIQVRPSATLTSAWSRNQLDLSAYYSRDFHVKTGSEDNTQYGAAASGQVQAGRGTTVRLRLSGDQLTEPRTNINSISASRSPISLSSVAVSGEVEQKFGRLTLDATGNAVTQNYDDATALDGTPIPLGFRDNSIYLGSLEGRYNLGAATSLILHVEHQLIRYKTNPYFGFDRDSDSTRVEGGVGLRVTELISGDIRVGYFKQHNEDPRFQNSSGLSFSANVLYTVTPLTSLRIYADRSIEPGGSTVSSGNVRSTLALTVEHELLRNLVLTGYGRYARIDPQGNIGIANEFEGRAGAQYYLNRRYRLNAGYSIYKRTGSFGALTVNQLSAGLSATF